MSNFLGVVDNHHMRKLKMGPFYKVVFSNAFRFRIARHVVFWLAWISFYAFVKAYQLYEINDIPFSTSFPISWLEVLIQIPIDIIFCYLVLYYLLPHLFLKQRYFSFVFLWIVLVFSAAILQHVYYFWAVPNFRLALGLQPPVPRGTVLLGALSIIGSLNAEGGFAAAIRLGKLFFIKERESLLLMKEAKRVQPEKGETRELEFQPTFLYNVLNRLYSLAEKEHIDPANTIRKINNLILYISYHAKKTMLPLPKELEALSEYIELENHAHHHEVRFNYKIDGDPEGKSIIPYILIPLVENAFSTLGTTASSPPSLQIHIRIDGQHLFVDISSTKNADTSTLLGGKNANVLNIENRLQLRYPGAYSLKKTIEPEKLTISMHVDLSARLGI